MLTKKQIYHMAMKELDRRRRSRVQNTKLHQKEVISASPRIQELLIKLRQTSVSISKEILSETKNPTFSIEDLQKQNQLTQLQITEELKSLNLPADYLFPPPECSYCEDYGYVEGKKCECLEKLIQEISMREFQKSANLKLSRFCDFDLSLYSDEITDNLPISPRKQMEKVFSFCYKYAENFSPSAKGILMLGKTGLGKTHLSLAIARNVLEQGYSVIYGSASELVSKMSDNYFKKTSSNEQPIDLLFSADLLIIDDLGAEFESAFSAAALYELINNRLLSGRSIIINSNLTPKEIENRYSDRIVSRIFSQMTPLQFLGTDNRTKIN